MKSIKLNDARRASIRRELMKRTALHTTKTKTLVTMERNLAQAVYNWVYPENVQTIMRSLPPEFFYYSTTVRVGFGSGKYEHLYLEEPHPFAEAHRCSAIAAFGDKSNAITAAYDKWAALREKVKSEWKVLEAQTAETLENYNTTKQLVDAWPEVAPIVESLFYRAQSTTAPLPAIPQDMNKIFGLPITPSPQQERK